MRLATEGWRLSGQTGSGVGRNRIRCLVTGAEHVHEPADQRLPAFACGLDDGLERGISVRPVGVF